MYILIHIVDAAKVDKNEDSEVVDFIDKNIACTLPDEKKYAEMINLMKKVQIHHHITTCRKKKSVVCRFSGPWTTADQTRIVYSEEKIDESKAG